ncbi:MAG: ABC transporter substrate-binding protein [Bdellovibrionota bacterium]
MRSIRFRYISIALAFVLTGTPACTSKDRKRDPANTLRLASVAKIKGFDPAFADDLYSGLEVERSYEGLLQYHYLKRPYTLIPNLAESMPEQSADGRTLTFHLKKGVLFQDDASFKETGGKGREMVADDVVYSFKRLADPKLNSTGWWIFDGKIVGLNEWHDESAKSGTPDYSKVIEGLKTVDRYTVRMQLIKPSQQFLYFLAMPFAMVVPHEAVEKYGQEFLNHPVGTGPFKLSEFAQNRIVWDKNPTYRQELYPSEGDKGDREAGMLEDAGKPLPRADRVIVQIMEEAQPRWLNFMAGKLDTVSIPKDNYAQAVTPNKELAPELKAKGIRLEKYTQLDVTHFTFNMTDPLVGKNKLLRQAMSTVYDAIPYIDKFYNGMAIAAQGPIPPELAGYDPAFKSPYRQFNLQKAKDLLEKAGYPGGKGLPEIEFLTLADSTSRQDSEYAQLMFGQLGIKLKVDTNSWPQFIQKLKEKKGQLWSFAWGGDYPDAENFLQLFYSKNASPGPNDANYSNPEFDALYEKALTLKDTPQRTALYQQMQKMVAEDCPWIPVAHRLGLGLIQPWLKNYKYNDVEHSRGKYLRVDPALKK